METGIVAHAHEPGGPHFVDCCGGDKVVMSLGPYENLVLATCDARQLREYINILLERAKSPDPTKEN
jgi:hypothetical protein